MSDYGNAVAQIARKELLQHIRSTRLIVVAVLLLASLIVMTIVLPLTMGVDRFFPDKADFEGEDQLDYFPSRANFAMTLFLAAPVVGGLFFMQVLSIVMTSDAVCAEWNNRTIFLLLSKPVPRTAFVLGKFLGSVVPLLVMVFLVMTINYLLLQGILGGGSTAEDWGRFFGGLGMLLVGLTAFATLGLFVSTIWRSTLASLFTTFGIAFLALPMIALIPQFGILGGQVDFEDRNDPQYDWGRYFSPGTIMTKSTDLIGGEEFGAFALTGLVPSFPPAHTWLAVVSGLALSGIFLFGALTVVRFRNFE